VSSPSSAMVGNRAGHAQAAAGTTSIPTTFADTPSRPRMKPIPCLGPFHRRTQRTQLGDDL